MFLFYSIQCSFDIYESLKKRHAKHFILKEQMRGKLPEGQIFSIGT